MKDRFTRLLGEIKRPGIDGLTDWLVNKSDFMTAPASAKYHGANEGGLLEHSLVTYDALSLILPNCPVKISKETTIICGLLHDVCKANFYQKSERNAKDEKGNWIKVPFYQIEDRFPFGHGEKSTYILNEFIHLSVEEAMAIRWHMGAWGAESYAERQSLNAAMEKYPLILALQMADQVATYYARR